MDFVLFSGYLLFFCWLVTKTGFFRGAQLGTSVLLLLFLGKVILAILYGWQGLRYTNLIRLGDSWSWHFSSLLETQSLKKNPLSFFEGFSNTYSNGLGGFLSSRSSWWNDLHYKSYIKLFALFNLFSNGNYYINAIFYSFLTFFGPVALYRMMRDAFPLRKAAVFIGAFLIPSFLYWGSGLHKDGLTLLGVALISYHFYFFLKRKRLSLQGSLVIMIGLLLLLLYRNYLLITLPPALIAWAIAYRNPKNALLAFSLVYTIFLVVLFTLPYLAPGLNLPRAMVEKQEDFMAHKGNSALPARKLQPHFTSFIREMPHALERSLLRPLPTDASHPFAMAASLENLVLLFVLILFILFPQVPPGQGPFLLYCLFLSVSVFLIIGYTVNFFGATVRYRSIFLPIFYTPLIACTNWRKINPIHIIKNNM